MTMDYLEMKGILVSKENYELVYTGELKEGMSLDDIFTEFNIDHPADFTGHSLSVSDVVVLHQDGRTQAIMWILRLQGDTGVYKRKWMWKRRLWVKKSRLWMWQIQL